uniref:Integrator complex subunit 6-like beta-barrel domain-containing protein n=1 Tax=Setaria digitata TaxID=48799 RepID=A0A915PHN2_9BILA
MTLSCAVASAPSLNCSVKWPRTLFSSLWYQVLAGWRESQSVFQEQLKLLRPHGLTSFGTALGSALRFVNVNRLQTGIDNFGAGRYPFYIEPVVIISITDGNCLTCPQFGTVNEIKVAKPTAIGNELIEEPFRWDQRLYSIVLRLGGSMPLGKTSPGMNIPSDNSPIDAMCIATGGRSYCVSSHKMLAMCVESVVQKLQQQGIVLRFEKYGPDPLLNPDRTNGIIENGNSKKNGELSSIGGKSVNSDNWRIVTCTVYSRASRSYPGHWPIPEAFWPDRSMISLPPRKAHPVISFRCESCEPLVCQDFPFDKYELEPSPLTRFILERKQPGVCWQVFVHNSSVLGSSPAPFGYLKAATNLSCVNLFIMPYNYPLLLPLIEEIKMDSKAKNSHSWRLRLEKYLATVPSYYVQPLKKAFTRLNISHPMLEPDQMQQYSYNILSYIAKVKHMAREEFESLCSTVASSLQISVPPLSVVGVQKRARLRDSRSVKKISGYNDVDNFHGFQVQVDIPKILIAPSLQFRNPFEIKRSRLFEQVQKMRINLMQQLTMGQIPVFEGGRPGTSIKLQHAEDLHNLPISQMGNYQEYIKSLEAVGRGPLREVEPQAIRVHAFGNPFKIDKKTMAVDEVGEGNLLGTSPKVETSKKRLSSTNSSASSTDSSRPPRRKAGPLAPDSLSRWRRRRRRNTSSCSSTASLSDLEVISLSSDLSAENTQTVSASGSSCEPSTSGLNGNVEHRLNGDVHEKSVKRVSPIRSQFSLLEKKPRLEGTSPRLEESALREKKLLMGKFVRKLVNAEKVLSMQSTEIEDLCIVDRRICLRYALREARRFRRKTLIDLITKQLNQMLPDASNSDDL